MKLFFIITILSFSNLLAAQVGLQIGETSILKIEQPNSIIFNPNKIPSLTEVFKTKNSIRHTPKAYCYSDLAFFCKVEVELEKVSKLPIKFRLGDVRYVDYLEGKIDAY